MSHITYYYIMFFITYTFKRQVNVFAGGVTCPAILKIFLSPGPLCSISSGSSLFAKVPILRMKMEQYLMCCLHYIKILISSKYRGAISYSEDKNSEDPDQLSSPELLLAVLLCHKTNAEPTSPVLAQHWFYVNH